MEQFENDIKLILQTYKITASKDENYNQWEFEISRLGKKIGTLRRQQKRQIIANFLETIIRWHNIKLNNKTGILFVESFIGKQYDVRIIFDLLRSKINMQYKDDQCDFDFTDINQKYCSILESRLNNFDEQFLNFTEKHQKT